MLLDGGRDEPFRAAHRFLQLQTRGQPGGDRSRVSAASPVSLHTARKRRGKLRHAPSGEEQIDGFVTAKMAAFQQDRDAIAIQ